MSTLPNWRSRSVEVGVEVYMWSVQPNGLLAILRPRQETEISIQDRHPTRKCTLL
jgi:hypothetical protein